jgi:hypothetical protein
MINTRKILKCFLKEFKAHTITSKQEILSSAFLLREAVVPSPTMG